MNHGRSPPYLGSKGAELWGAVRLVTTTGVMEPSGREGGCNAGLRCRGSVGGRTKQEPDGVGIALSGKYLEDLPFRVWVPCGDSELAKGSIWEAIDKASYYKLQSCRGGHQPAEATWTD